MPKELQEGPPALLDSPMPRAMALSEAGQDPNVLREPEGQARQPEIQQGQEVSHLLATELCFAELGWAGLCCIKCHEVGLVHGTLCCAVLCCAAACSA